MLKRLFVSIIILGIGVFMTPSCFGNSDKYVTLVDKLGGYIYSNSNNSWEDSHYIATALVTRSSPSDLTLLTSIAKQEADFSPYVVGDSGKSLYMFQVQPKHHGPVPMNVFEQVSKARKVLYGFKTKNMNRLVWVSRYNGSGIDSRRYASRVIKTSKLLERNLFNHAYTTV